MPFLFLQVNFIQVLAFVVGEPLRQVDKLDIPDQKGKPESYLSNSLITKTKNKQNKMLKRFALRRDVDNISEFQVDVFLTLPIIA